MHIQVPTTIVIKVIPNQLQFFLINLYTTELEPQRKFALVHTPTAILIYHLEGCLW